LAGLLLARYARRFNDKLLDLEADRAGFHNFEHENLAPIRPRLIVYLPPRIRTATEPEALEMARLRRNCSYYQGLPKELEDRPDFRFQRAENEPDAAENWPEIGGWTGQHLFRDSTGCGKLVHEEVSSVVSVVHRHCRPAEG
jgi:hypothetical protein